MHEKKIGKIENRPILSMIVILVLMIVGMGHAFAPAIAGAAVATSTASIQASSSASATPVSNPSVASSSVDASQQSAASQVASSSAFTIVPISIYIPDSIKYAPDISSIAAASTTATSTIITWSTPNEISDSTVIYGTTTAYAATSTGNLALNHSVALVGLAPDTVYHFQVSSSDSYGSSVSPDETFTTSALPVQSSIVPPQISIISVIPTYTIATITWSTDEPSTSAVLYGPSPDSATSTSGSAGLAEQLSTTHVVSIENLTPGTTYYFAVRSANEMGVITTSRASTFSTISESLQ